MSYVVYTNSMMEKEFTISQVAQIQLNILFKVGLLLK